MAASRCAIRNFLIPLPANPFVMLAYLGGIARENAMVRSRIVGCRPLVPNTR